jgi:hypothetical protein
MKTLKAITLILTTVLALNFSSLFAANEGPVFNLNDATITTLFPFLAPTTPAEATYEEGFDLGTNTIDLFSLEPVMPKEADFNDMLQDENVSMKDLTPVTPVEADFTDDDLQTIPVGLAPVTPAVADFTDGE